MATIPRKKAVRNPPEPCRFELSLDPEFQKLMEEFDIPEVIHILKAHKAKRLKGRPTRANRDEILNQAARAKAEKGEYAPIAPRLGMTSKALRNLVGRNRRAFDEKVRQFAPTRK